jgi:hypothetical protein
VNGGAYLCWRHAHGARTVKNARGVVNCQFAFRCNMSWGELRKIDGSPGVRYCSQCETAVHFCRNEEELELHAAKGHCVAYGASVEGKAQDASDRMAVGMVRPPGYTRSAGALGEDGDPVAESC